MKNDVPDEWRRRQKAGLCPVCGKTAEEFEKRMRVFCSKKCRQEYADKYTFWSVVREEILERDGKVCADCSITYEKYLESHEKEKKKRLKGWIEQNQSAIDGERDEQLVRLSERFEEQYNQIMNDFWIADRLINWGRNADLRQELYRGLEYNPPSFEIDHIKAVCLGGDMWDKNNMRVLCNECHKKKTKEDHRKRKLIDGQSNLDGEVIK